MYTFAHPAGVSAPILQLEVGLAAAVIFLFAGVSALLAGFTGPIAGILMRVTLLKAILGGGNQGQNGEGQGAIADTALLVVIIAGMFTLVTLFSTELILAGIGAVTIAAMVIKFR